MLNNKYIVWDHWFKAYQWDISSNTLKVYQKLTQDHFFLNSELKMRNKLAEDVLDENMLHLMEVYSDSLGEKANELASSVELLKNTSVLVKFFRDSRPIKNYQDNRLENCRKVLHWFRNWEQQIKQTEMSNKDKDKSLLSAQTREDLVSCIIGFDEMCQDRFKRSFGSIVPARINSDAIENIFSQQRGIHNGPNTNPDYLTYCRATNSIILGETPVSRKTNTGAVAQGAHFLALSTCNKLKRLPLQASQLANTQNQVCIYYISEVQIKFIFQGNFCISPPLKLRLKSTGKLTDKNSLPLSLYFINTLFYA
jgi:hypothetical protein